MTFSWIQLTSVIVDYYSLNLFTHWFINNWIEYDLQLITISGSGSDTLYIYVCIVAILSIANTQSVK